MTNLFQLNLLLAIGWCGLLGSFTLANFAAGFAVAFCALSVVSPLFGHTGYFRRVICMVRLLVYFLFELVVSSAHVVWDVLTPVHRARPAIIAVPLDITQPAQIAILANLLSLTPGSLSLDVSPDERTLYVHAMFVDDPDAMRRKIKSGFERLVKEAME